MSLPKRPLILVVDDDADIRGSLRDLLSDEGYAVGMAANGEEALAEMKRGDLPALVILDLMMPVLDGQGFRARQKADPELAAVPVIVITASGRVKDIAERMDVDDCLPKPLVIGRLLDLVARHAGHPGLSA